MAQSSSAQVVGNIGMYYAAYRLWNVTPTAGGTKGRRPALSVAKHFKRSREALRCIPTWMRNARAH